ncbi:NAD(P)-dependent oxidoreductase [Candidatus Woesearchaeota archaeon]|nr:NAD(P)-dependent oxidoreductase [Candidatus Woesearchaeota archaeon]
MKVLIVGVSGFIGKNFIELCPKDIEVTGIYNSSKDIKNFVKEKKLNVKLHKCNLRDEKEVKKLTKTIGNKFDKCIFLAGNVNVPLSKEDPGEDLEATTGILINFLQNFSIKKFIYMSTAGVYDGIKGKATINSPLSPTVPYCISKLLAEQYVKFYSSINKIENYVILRFGGAFGKYSERKYMSKLVKEIKNNKEEIKIYGTGKNMINVMYVKDTVQALIKCLESKKANLTCNLCQENMTIRESVENTARALNKKVKIKLIPKVKGQKYITFFYASDFNKIFNFKPEFSFEEGIIDFAELVE